MRKLFAIFIISSMILYSILLCYAEEPGSTQNDLPLASKYETKQVLSELSTFTAEARSVLAEQQTNLDILGSISYLGYAYMDRFDGVSLDRSVSWNGKLEIDSPIYKSELYKGYYRVRAEKLIKQYEGYQTLDYGASDKTARAAFEGYIKAAVKDETSWRNLVILLQERLMDQLPELEPSKRKAALEEMLALRKPENKALCQDFIYQIFERRVKTEFMGNMAEKNKVELLALTGKINIQITAEKGGSLQLKYTNAEGREAVLEILNVADTEGQYRGFTLLKEFYGRQGYNLHFTDDAGREYSIDMHSVQKAIGLDDKGHLQLKLDSLLTQNSPKNSDAIQTGDGEDLSTASAGVRLKELETVYYSKAAEAQSITRELNRYSIYLELKNKNISNSFSKKFEAEKKQWKAALDAKLNSFGPGGMADYAAYMKQFVLFSRTELGQSKEGKVLTARFRNAMVQYRQPDDSSLWIADMLYHLKNMK